MSASVRVGFAIGFVLAAIFGGAWAWREGLLTPAPVRQAQTSGETPPSSTQPPSAAPAPGGQDPSAAAPTPRPSSPDATRTPEATPPAASPPSAAPPATNPPPAAAATPRPGPAAAQDTPPVDERKGAFDVVRVEPSGEAVVAGRCAADCTAELTSNGKVIDTAKADAGGSFAMTPPTLPPGDHQLGLKVTTPEGARETSEQTVTVSVPKAPSKDVVVVLNEPDAPSKVLQQPGQAPAAASPEGDRTAARSDAAAPAVERVAGLSLGAIDAEKGRFFLQGTAPAGSKLRIYLNNTLVSEATAGADGRWSLRVERGLTAGRYTARVDHVGPDGKVMKRAEAGFDYEAEVAGGDAPAPSSGAASGPTVPNSPAAGGAPAGSAVDRSASASGGQGAASDGRQADAMRTPGDATTSGGLPSTAGGSLSPASRAADAASAAAGSGGVGESASTSDRRAAAETGGAASGSSGAASGTAPGDGSSPSGATSSETAKAPDASGKAQADPANPVVSSLDTAQVKRGDSLWSISRATYGLGRRYTVIFGANDKQIRDPDLIYPGQVLVLPPSAAGAAANR